jgi:peptide/nickel transport system permease protein
LLTVSFAGLAGVALSRYAPGFGVDERELDGHLTRESVDRIRESRREGQELLPFLIQSARRIARGDLGFSTQLHEPIATLLRDRVPVTARLITEGVLTAISLAFGSALLATISGRRVLQGIGSSMAGVALCVPVAFLGLAALWFRASPQWVLALSVYPHLYRYAANLLESVWTCPQTMAARARGVNGWRINVVHLVWPCAPELAASAGMTASLAFGASVPIEYVTSTPGFGHLAWQAAASRDFPLLFVVTLLVAAFVSVATTLGEFVRVATNPLAEARC